MVQKTVQTLLDLCTSVIISLLWISIYHLYQQSFHQTINIKATNMKLFSATLALALSSLVTFGAAFEEATRRVSKILSPISCGALGASLCLLKFG